MPEEVSTLLCCSLTNYLLPVSHFFCEPQYHKVIFDQLSRDVLLLLFLPALQLSLGEGIEGIEIVLTIKVTV